MSSQTWAIVPIKAFASAKKRLASALEDSSRRELVRAMARDVIEALEGVSGLSGILVVTADEEVRGFARDLGVECWDDPADGDLTKSLEAAAEHLASTLSADTMIILPADVPLVSSALLFPVLSRHESLTLASDDEGEGTNLLIASPPNLIRFCYDGHGFHVHLQRGQALGIKPHIVSDPRIQLDIDTPRDLQRLRTLGKGVQGKHSLSVLAKSSH